MKLAAEEPYKPSFIMFLRDFPASLPKTGSLT